MKFLQKKKIRSALCLALVAAYVAGLLCMIFVNMRTGLTLWGISTLGGICLIHFIRQSDEQAQEKDGAQRDDG